jgi:hypothetical protein
VALGAAALAATLACGAVAHAQVPPPPPPAGAPTDADAQAAKWLKVGNAAFKAGDFAGAEKAYREAFAVKKGYDIAGDLGMAELAQGKQREAAQHLAFTLRLFPITGEPAVREQMQKAYDQCRTGVSAVKVTVGVKGAQVLVDGAPAGDSPLLDPVYVDPGDHVIEARLDGYTGSSQRVTVDKGGEAEVALVLTPIPGQVRTVVREVQVPARRRSLVPGLALAGVTVVGVVGGVAFLSLSSAQKSDAETTRTALLTRRESCVTNAKNYAGMTACNDLAGEFKTDDTLHDAAVGAFVVGAAAAAGTVLYFLWPMKRQAPPAQGALRDLHVTPVVAGPRDGALLVSGSF